MGAAGSVGAVPVVQRRRRVRVRGALRAALVELHLVHRPHGALHVLHAHEALVERQVVSHRVLTPLNRYFICFNRPMRYD